MTRQEFQAMIFAAYPWLQTSHQSLPECVRIACEKEFIEPKMSEQEQGKLRRFAKQLDKQGWFTFDDESPKV